MDQIAMADVQNPDKRHDDHERRLSHVETVTQNMSEQMTDGFNRITTAIDHLSDVQAKRQSEIHRRIDAHERDSKITWPLIFSFVSAAFLLGGLLVGYVNIMVDPLADRQSEIRREMRDGFSLQTTQIQTEVAGVNAERRLEVDRILGLVKANSAETDKLMNREIVCAEKRGRMLADIEWMEKTQSEGL